MKKHLINKHNSPLNKNRANVLTTIDKWIESGFLLNKNVRCSLASPCLISILIAIKLPVFPIYSLVSLR